jgi:predicted O-methyltransferase YrrM
MDEELVPLPDSILNVIPTAKAIYNENPNIHTFLLNHGFYNFEGYSQEVNQQVKDLISLTSKPNIRVMEIGFNAGHSAEVFLKNNPTLELTSFDLGVHDYCSTAKEFIDMLYPNRHTLILGDSTMTVPKFTSEHPNARFDVIFIDGGHTYDIATADILNCKMLAHKDTIVILDDTYYSSDCIHSYIIDVNKVWTEQVSRNFITEIDKKDYCLNRGMSWGTYTTASSSSHSSSN